MQQRGATTSGAYRLCVDPGPSSQEREESGMAANAMDVPHGQYVLHEHDEADGAPRPPRHDLPCAAPKRCDPAVVGLAAYAITAGLFQVKNFGLCGGAPAVTAGIFFGGVTQLIAGLQCFQVGNHFGYCAFSCYGAMWLALPSLGLVRTMELVPVGDRDYTAFLCLFGLYTLMLTVAALWHHLALFICVLFLFGGFLFLTVFHWLRDCGATVGLHWKYSGRNESSVEACERLGHHDYVWSEYVAAVSITVSCLAAMYIVFGILLKESGVRLPMGPKPSDSFMHLLHVEKAAKRGPVRSDSVALAHYAAEH